MRFRPALLSLVLASPAAVLASPDGPPPPRPEMIVDSSWTPDAGDTATVHPIGAPSFPSVRLAEEYIRFSEARDGVGMSKAASDGSAVVLDVGTGVRIVQVHGRPVYAGPSIMTRAQMGRSIQDAILNPAAHPPAHITAEIRVLDGPHKDELRFVAADSLARLKPSRWVDPRERKPAEKPKPVVPAVRAATLLQSARNLERSGNLKAAGENYRRIVEDFHQTPSSRLAADRLKLLDGRKTP